VIVNILVRSPNWIGDQILAYPFYFHLRRAFPNAKITSLCVPWVQDLQYLTLIDQTLVLDRPSPGGWITKASYLKAQAERIVAESKFDIAVTLSDSFSSALIFWLARIPKRIGYATDFRSLLLTNPIRSSEHVEPRGLTYLKLLQAIGNEAPLTSADARESMNHFSVDEWLVPSKDPFAAIKAKTQGRYYVLAPGATADSRRWPVDSWVELCRRIHERYGLTGLVVGGAKEAPLAERLIQEEGVHLLDATARGKVSDLYTLFKEAQFSITNESGLAHLSALASPFTQIICGAANPERTRPLGPKPVSVSFNAISCWPCEKNDCRLKTQKLACLLGITSERVFSEISLQYERILAGFSLDNPEETA